MPYHRIPVQDAPVMVPVYEKAGEQIAAVFREGDHYAIFTNLIGIVQIINGRCVFRVPDDYQDNPGAATPRPLPVDPLG